MSNGEFRMPDVGEGIAQAEIIEWLVTVGDKVAEDQGLVLVETDKSQVELPAPTSGTIRSLHAEVGGVVGVGELLVVIDDGTLEETGGQNAGDAQGGVADIARPRRAQPQGTGTGDPGSLSQSGASDETPAPTPAPVMDGGVAVTTPSGRVLASPYTRRLAVSREIDINTVRGTGPHGRVQVSDLDDPRSVDEGSGSAPSTSEALVQPDRARVSHAGSARENTVVPIRGLRRQIARSMTLSLQVPHVLEFREIDASALLAAHQVLKAELGHDGLKLSVLPLLMAATIRALHRHPNFNATYDADREEVMQYGGVHLGMATATDDGLIVPVLHDADLLSIDGLSLAIDRAADRARRRQASPEELSGGSFTVTNFGSFGTWLGTPIIRRPEVGIAGFGRISEKVIAVDGAPAVRPVLPLVVAADHRINDGAHLGAFVGEITKTLSEPVLLLA